MRTLVSSTRRLLLNAENRDNGLQMAAAVVAAYVASLAAGLPEHFWAVMSALIVMRPNMASTFDAALDRIGSTLLGALCGLLGVWVENLGVNALFATLAIVAALAYLSAAIPAMRGAPIAALIVLSAAALIGHSALQVAFLRVLQIIIGVGVAIAISKLSAKYRAADRLHAGCAKILRGAALRLAEAGVQPRPNEAEAAFASETARRALDRLAAIAASADKASRIFRRTETAGDRRYHRRIAGLTGRIFQDVAVFNRIMLADSRQEDGGSWREAADVVRAAVAHTADVIEGGAQSDLSQLRQFAGDLVLRSKDEETRARPEALLAAPLHLLSEDLGRLSQCVRKRPKGAPRQRQLPATQT